VAHADAAGAPVGLFSDGGAVGGVVCRPHRALVLALDWRDFAHGRAICRGSRFFHFFKCVFFFNK